jgi:hypothetical protein
MNDKLLLSTTRDIGPKTSQGSIFFEELDILYKYEIFFAKKIYVNFFWRGKINYPNDDYNATNKLINQEEPVSISEKTNDFK